MLIMTRRLFFHAAHRMSSPNNGGLRVTGHTYLLDVGVRGAIQPETGLLINIKELDAIVKQHIVAHLQDSCINDAVPFFQSRPVSSEYLALYIAETLLPLLETTSVRIHSVRIQPLPTLFSEWIWHLENPIMLVTRIYEFSASHRLYSEDLSEEENLELFGKCSNPNGHGHNYQLEVTIEGPINPHTGRILPIQVLDNLVEREVLARYDHRHLNLDVPDFFHAVPTAEMIVKTIWERLQPFIPTPARLYRLRLHETPRNLFEYFGEDETER